MKKLKQVINQIKTGTIETPEALNNLLWQLICYSPKMPVRLQQEQLLNSAMNFSLLVKDEYFAEKELLFNGFKWGNGSRKVFITHGWGSKAADFAELITALTALDNIQVIAFDAPGNGSSEGELSNLLLFTLAAKAVIQNYGAPDVLIGHSLGAMANVFAVQEMQIAPKLLISIAPLIRLKENFEASMTAVEIPQAAREKFLQSFEDKFGKPASFYNLNERYALNEKAGHMVFYDPNDLVSVYPYLGEFLTSHPFIKSKNYDDTGHEKIIKSAVVIDDLVYKIKAFLDA